MKKTKIRKPKKDRPSKEKAREMLAHGTVHGQPLTQSQKNLFRMIAHGR